MQVEAPNNTTTDVNHNYTLTPPLTLYVKHPATPPPTLYVAQQLCHCAANCSCSFSMPSSLPPHGNYSFVSLPALLQMQNEAHYDTTTNVNHPYTLTQPLPLNVKQPATPPPMLYGAQQLCHCATNCSPIFLVPIPPQVVPHDPATSEGACPCLSSEGVLPYKSTPLIPLLHYNN
jgi:hypothetical protein